MIVDVIGLRPLADRMLALQSPDNLSVATLRIISEARKRTNNN